MALFILNLRTVVISMTLQKLEPRAIYLHGPDSSHSKALLRKSFLHLEGFLDGSFVCYCLESIILFQIF